MDYLTLLNQTLRKDFHKKEEVFQRINNLCGTYSMLFIEDTILYGPRRAHWITGHTIENYSMFYLLYRIATLITLSKYYIDPIDEVENHLRKDIYGYNNQAQLFKTRLAEKSSRIKTSLKDLD